jgi:hypothetical protein
MLLQDSVDLFAEGKAAKLFTLKSNSSQSAASKPCSSQHKASVSSAPKIEEISSYLKEVLLTVASLGCH